MLKNVHIQREKIATQIKQETKVILPSKMLRLQLSSGFRSGKKPAHKSPQIL